MESNHTSQDFNFQYYVDMAKQKEIAWHVFVKLIKDFSYSDISKLKYVNAILLTKLTDSYHNLPGRFELFILSKLTRNSRQK